MKTNLYSQQANEILKSKIDYFGRYEEITNKMFIDDDEKLMDYIDQRQDLMTQIDNLDQSLNLLYSNSCDESLKQAVLNKIAWGECPSELQDVFLNGQKLISIVARILRKEEQVVDNIEAQKEVLLKLIKEHNTGVNANASKYYGISKQIEKKFTLFDNKY